MYRSCIARRAASPLTGDPDEDPTGDAGLPICGECDRSRNFDAIEEVELAGLGPDDDD